VSAGKEILGWCSVIKLGKAEVEKTKIQTITIYNVGLLLNFIIIYWYILLSLNIIFLE